MAYSDKVTFKKINIKRLVQLHDDTEKPAPAYEFGNGKTIFEEPEIPGQPYRRKMIREKDIDPSLR